MRDSRGSVLVHPSHGPLPPSTIPRLSPLPGHSPFVLLSEILPNSEFIYVPMMLFILLLPFIFFHLIGANERMISDEGDIRLAEASVKVAKALNKINRARLDIGLAQERLDQVCVGNIRVIGSVGA